MDTREKKPLIFPSCDGVSIVSDTVMVGDYTARFNGVNDNYTVERKSKSDLWSSFVL